MNLKSTLLVFATLLYLPTLVSSQNTNSNQFKVLKNGNGSRSKTIIALVGQEIINDPSIFFDENQLASYNTSAYLFVNTISLETLYTELNHLSRSSSSEFNKDALQLIIIGTQNELERYQSLDLNYFSSHYFVSSDNSKAKQSFITVKDEEWNSENYLESVKGKYLWSIDKNRKSPKDSLINYEAGRLTGGYRPVFNIGLKNNNLGSYYTNGLSLDYAMGKNIQLFTSGSFAIQRPKIQDEIESQVRSQIDIFGIINGSVSEPEVTLSLPIKSQLYASGNLGLRYLFTPQKDWSFYGSTELSFNLSTKISGQLDTTVTLVFPNNFSPANIDEGAAGLEQREAVNINSGIGAGFQYKIGGHWRLDLSLNYSTCLIRVRSTDNLNNNAFNIALGLNYRFKDNKEFTKVYFY